MTLWFHLRCGAFKRPEVFLAALEGHAVNIEAERELSEAARLGLAYRRLPRVDGVHRAPTSRARCRCCRELISKDTWRIPLVYYEEGRFNPSGFIHLACTDEYFGTRDVIDRLTHFSALLNAEDVADIQSVLEKR